MKNYTLKYLGYADQYWPRSESTGQYFLLTTEYRVRMHVGEWWSTLSQVLCDLMDSGRPTLHTFNQGYSPPIQLIINTFHVPSYQPFHSVLTVHIIHGIHAIHIILTIHGIHAIHIILTIHANKRIIHS